jgi:hypothetical protein
MKYEYEIIKRLGTLSVEESGGRREVGIVSWNGGPAMLDIRTWRRGRSAPNPVGKIRLTCKETELLRNTLHELNLEDIPE